MGGVGPEVGTGPGEETVKCSNKGSGAWGRVPSGRRPAF